MSFGRPPSINLGFKPSPPDRGSFPLDHYGECKDKMMLYMTCLKANSSNSTPCREVSKEYLNCRMDKGLMERDDWKNLGLSASKTASPVDPSSSPAQPPVPPRKSS
ncbi:hypothetical protein BDZ89DRAFT_1069912 [Hymenopellis radicata]|nr:hypothetical protein BDZ89DRAFT_1069912 [Hymenopellis radicata]